MFLREWQYNRSKVGSSHSNLIKSGVVSYDEQSNKISQTDANLRTTNWMVFLSNAVLAILKPEQRQLLKGKIIEILDTCCISIVPDTNGIGSGTTVVNRPSTDIILMDFVEEEHFATDSSAGTVDRRRHVKGVAAGLAAGLLVPT